MQYTSEPLFVLLSHIFSVYKFSFMYNRSYAYLIQSDEAVIADETLVSLKRLIKIIKLYVYRIKLFAAGFLALHH